LASTSKTRNGRKALVDISHQVELIKKLRELGTSLDVPFVINARVDVFLLASGDPESRLAHAVQRANAYRKAGADCTYPIGRFELAVIADLVTMIEGPVNILGGPPGPTIPELAKAGVARVSFGGRMMSSVLGHLRGIAFEILEHGTYTKMKAETLSGAEFGALFSN